MSINQLKPVLFKVDEDVLTLKFKHLKFVGCAISLLLALFTAHIQAQNIVTSQYFYDDKGRLIKVIDSTGDVAEYIYDRAGNIVEIKRSSVAGNLFIFSFTPQQGAPGTLVTINGQGFSSVSSNNIVRFNGTAALITSASTSRLAARVPAGATTGPISVTVGANTALTDRNFIVFPAPAINSISPRFAERATSLFLRMNGINLIGSTFSILPASVPPKITVASANIEPDGTSALLNLSLDSSALGAFTVVAANSSGNSDSSITSANTFTIVVPGAPDIDGDGLSNNEEAQRGTDPANPDTDGDGFIDGLEAQFGSDPLNRNSVPELTDPTKEAVGAFFSIKSLAAPPGVEAKETVGSVFSVKDIAAPPGDEAREAVSLFFSLKNLSAPAGDEAKETVCLTFSLKNSASPSGPEAGEAISPVFSLRRTSAPNAQAKKKDQ
jgi:YD repeat-containing protein